jgi:hypothetical protein
MDVRVPWMNHSGPSSKRNFKYVHDTVPRSAISTGFEYMLGHDVCELLQVYCKLVKSHIWSIALFGVETWTLRNVEQKFLGSF